MKSAVRRWGHNLAVRIPPEIAQQAKLKEGQDLTLEVVDGRIVMSRLAEVVPLKNTQDTK